MNRTFVIFLLLAFPLTGFAGQRIGVFVGVDKYKHKQYRRLGVAVKDVKAIAERMCPSLDKTIELHNENATYRAVESLFTVELPKLSKPGDTVFIVWSGHGDHCPDDDGDEEDGLDEYLCPYDVDKEDPRTFVLDDKLYAWIQKLEERQIVLILDACYSAGMQKGPGKTFDFFGDEIGRDKTKEKSTHIVFASSSGNEISFVHRSMKYSVFTYFLVEFLDKDKHGDIRDAQKYMKPRIVEYLENFHATKDSVGASLFYPVSKPIRLKSR